MRASQEKAFAVALFLAAATAVVALALLTRDCIPIGQGTAKMLGRILASGGSLLVIRAVAYIRRGVVGRVNPLLGKLIRSGPYRRMRHPVYLGLLLILIGVALVLRSWPEPVAVVLLFLPAVIHRAKLEEAALRERFGSDWDPYRAQTGFLLPRRRRGSPHGRK